MGLLDGVYEKVGQELSDEDKKTYHVDITDDYKNRKASHAAAKEIISGDSGIIRRIEKPRLSDRLPSFRNILLFLLILLCVIIIADHLKGEKRFAKKLGLRQRSRRSARQRRRR